MFARRIGRRNFGATCVNLSIPFIGALALLSVFLFAPNTAVADSCVPEEDASCMPTIEVTGPSPPWGGGSGVVGVGGGTGCGGCTGGGNSGGGWGTSSGTVPDAPDNPTPATCRSDALTREAHAQSDGRYLRVDRYPNVPQTGSIWQVNFDDGGSEMYYWTGMSAPFGHAIPGTLRCP